nr:hypothetical protein [Bradyrhizobium brasilense]
MSEIWEITSVGMAHPFHVHGALFRILSLDDNPPPGHLTGWGGQGRTPGQVHETGDPRASLHVPLAHP